MSVPALAQMGKLTGERRYYDDAVKQVLQFSRRMFNRDLGLFMHGWVQGMEVHPEFRWLVKTHRLEINDSSTQLYK